MADYLVVHVISADVPSSSSTSPNSYFVKLHYNGQNSTTSIKENVPKWDEKTCFHTRAQADQSSDLTLEAKVYNSSKLLGTVSLSDVYFDRHSDAVVAIRHAWKDTSSAVVSRASGGELLLKVFLAAADEVQRNILDRNYKLAIEDRSEGNIVDQHPPIALQPADTVPIKITPNFEPGRVVERMQHLFVRVVKARRLPDVDANGSLDPYVEVTFGAYKRVTKFLKRNKNPEWNETFAFSLQHGKPPSSSVDVVVNDKDLVRDDFVGKLISIDVATIPERYPDDIPLEPTWRPLVDQGGKKLAHEACLLIAIWIGSQSDEAYRHAWISQYSPKVYQTPRLWCLRVSIFEAQGITLADGMADSTRVFCKACLGSLVQKTRARDRQMISSGGYVWNEDLLFVAAEPFFEGDDLVVSVISGTGDDETEIIENGIIGTCAVSLASIDKRADNDHLIAPRLFDLENPAVPPLLDGVDDGNGNRNMKIFLRNLLEGGYHIGPSSPDYVDDTRPADRKLWDPPIGYVHLGILRAVGLKSSNENDGISLNPYCVAKYGDKWVRTRTAIDGGPEHVFNEQYTWDVYDITTVLNVGVFDHGMLKDHRKIGNLVRIRLSCLQTDRIYAHSYPLVIFSPSGATKTGELHLAVKISLASSINMLRIYAQPTLPRMHFVQPLTEGPGVEYELRSQAANILALRLGQMEPPLRSEIVACICQTEVYLWSFRKGKANFYRLMGVVSPFLHGFEGVCMWRNPAVTLLVHAIFALAIWFPKMVLLLVSLYVALVAGWNYRLCPSCPPHVDYRLSLIDTTHPDELHEEFDTFPTSCSEEVIRMRYDRLRHVAGRIQTLMGGFASLGERIHSLVTWRDPRATAIFYLFVTMIAVTAYFVPFKVHVAGAGFYVMRHPRIRTKTPSIFYNFFRRLPCKKDSCA